MTRIKYKLTYRKKTRVKTCTGFLRIPEDLPQQHDVEQLDQFFCKKHNLQPEWLIERKLFNHINKNYNYTNVKQRTK